MKINKYIFLLFLIFLVIQCFSFAVPQSNINQTEEIERLGKECERLRNERDKYYQEAEILRKNVDSVISDKLTIYSHYLSKKIWDEFEKKLNWFIGIISIIIVVLGAFGYWNLKALIENRIEEKVTKEIRKKEDDISGLREQIISAVVDFQIEAKNSLDKIKEMSQEVEKKGEETLETFEKLKDDVAVGDTQTIIEQLKKNPHIHRTDDKGKTLLHYASYFGQLEIVKILLSMEYKIESIDNDGNTPLILASEAGRDDVVKFLISQGANIETQNDDGWRPLHQSASNGHLEISKILIENKADINVKNKDGETPLHRAIIEGHKKIVELLTDKECLINDKDNNDWTPLHLAVTGGYTEIVDILIKRKVGVNARGENGSTPLHYAVLGHKNIVELLLNANADVNIRNLDGDTPLDLAVDNDFGEIAELLRNHGAKQNKYRIDSDSI